ncbi:MAG: dienelactone hydrolase family protein [Oceanihabitans sp.]
MKQITRIFAILFITTLFVNCSSSNDDGPGDITRDRTFADLEQDFSEIEFTTGVNDVAILNFDNELWRFRVIMPDVDFTNNKRPLIITLHGYAGTATDAHQNTACYAEPGFESLDPIIISPFGSDLQWFEIFNQELVLNLVVLAKNHLPVDEDKVVVNGYSDGGSGAWYFSEYYPQLFSAGVPMASAYGNYNPNGSAHYISIPMYAIHGENDELFPLENAQNWIDATTLSGTDVTFVVAPGLTHPEPCSYVPYLEDASAWLVNEVW